MDTGRRNTVRLLEPHEIPLIFEWDDEMASSKRWVSSMFATFEKPDISTPDWTHIGVFEPDLCACISLQGDDIAEAHISVKPGRKPDLFRALIAVKRWWFSTSQKTVIVWILRQNRAVRRVMERIGFSETGIQRS